MQRVLVRRSLCCPLGRSSLLPLPTTMTVTTVATIAAAAVTPATILTSARFCSGLYSNSGTTTDGTGSSSSTSTTTTTRNDTLASMDMKTGHGALVSRFTDVEKTASQQEDGCVPIAVTGRFTSVSSSSSSPPTCCAEDGHQNHWDSHAHENAGEGEGETTNGRTEFGRILNEEAAAMQIKPHRDTSVAPTTRALGREDKGASPSTSGSGCGAQSLCPSSSSSSLSVYHQLKTKQGAEAEMQRFLAQNALRSIQRITAPPPPETAVGASMSMAATSSSSVDALPSSTTSSSYSVRLEPGRRGVQALLDYNKQWAAEVTHFNPRYFTELAKEQKPEYLWIGCSDSRVPANEIIGLHPGDVFVHRNIANIFALSDLNCLSALQFAVDSLKVQHVIIAGHYKCGGVTAAMQGTTLGLTDHWIMQVTEIKNKWWPRVLQDVPPQNHLNVLCELNVLEQLSHVANCRIVQRMWIAQNALMNHDGGSCRNSSSSSWRHVHVRPHTAAAQLLAKNGYSSSLSSSPPASSGAFPEELEVHGWVYSLDDGMLRPLLTLTRFSDVKKEISDALEAVFVRHSQIS